MDNIKKMYDVAMEAYFRTEGIKLGPWTSESMMHDPKHLAFVLSRYKFCAKMLEGRKSVMEVGCGDSFGLPIVAQSVEKVYAVDWEEKFIKENAERLKFLSNVQFIHKNLNISPMKEIKVSAIYSIDVIEHIDPESEAVFMKNMISAYENEETAMLLIGTPNLSAAQYASPQSEALHINLKNHQSLKDLLSDYFLNVLMFGMNDEVLHTGYAPMCQYLWGIGIGLKRT